MQIEQSSSIPWRAWAVAVGRYTVMKLDTVLIAVVVSLATSLATAKLMQPSLNLRFEPSYPMIIPSAQRLNYGNDAFAIKIETDATLKNAIVRLLAISKAADLSNPINGIVQPALGWPAGEESFEPRTIGVQDYIIVATIRKTNDGKGHLTFFLNEFYGAPGPENKPLAELEFLKDLVPGTYYLRIGLLAEGTTPVAKTLKIVWEPSLALNSGLEMSIIK
jgi:hypothetical protein